MNYFKGFSKNIFSQNGEDGIFQELFRLLDITNGDLVEFGAWDGVWLSNTLNIFKNNSNFRVILIESDSNKFKELERLANQYPNVIPINCSVSYERDDKNSLDQILTKNESDNIALLSIDIDSSDYYVYEAMQKHHPKVVCIETNGTYKIDSDVKTKNSGCSLLSLVKLSEIKGYSLVCHTGNAIFVRNDLVHLMPREDYTIENLFSDSNEIAYYQSINDLGIKTNSIYYLTDEYKKRVETFKQNL